MLEPFKRFPGPIDLIVRGVELAGCLGVTVLTIVEAHQSLRGSTDDSAHRIIKESEGPAQIYFKVALLNALQDGPILFLAFAKRIFPSLALGHIECGRQYCPLAFESN